MHQDLTCKPIPVLFPRIKLPPADCHFLRCVCDLKIPSQSLCIGSLEHIPTPSTNWCPSFLNSCMSNTIEKTDLDPEVHRYEQTFNIVQVVISQHYKIHLSLFLPVSTTPCETALPFLYSRKHPLPTKNQAGDLLSYLLSSHGFLCCLIHSDLFSRIPIAAPA